MRKTIALASVILLTASNFIAIAQEPAVRVAPPQLQGSRQLEKQTESSVVRDYLLSWKSMRQALDQNQVASLDPDFTGAARERLAETISSQQRMGIHARYQDRSHNLQIVFYSPEGLSIQMTDDVEYQQEVLEKDKVLSTSVVRQRYVIVLTPSETRWQVRIFQAALN